MKKLARAPRAQDQMYSAGRPMVVELAYDDNDSAALIGLMSKIEVALSKGSAVVVRGWEPRPSLDFSVEAIQMYRPTLSQPVVAQSM